MHAKLPAIPLPIVTHSELQGWALHAVARGEKKNGTEDITGGTSC